MLSSIFTRTLQPFSDSIDSPKAADSDLGWKGLAGQEGNALNRDDLMRRIHGTDIYAGYVPTLAEDLQGWNSKHQAFDEIIAELRPSIVIDVGVWKGGSTLYLADQLRQHDVAGSVIAVDTFLGSLEHIDAASDLFRLVPRRHGMPLLYEQFLSNVVRLGAQDRVVPLPQTSTTAALLLRAIGVQAGLIHIDASHEYAPVLQDARSYWEVLAPGGYMVGDDYDPFWPSVVKAADDFAAEKGVRLSHRAAKWIVRKPRLRVPITIEPIRVINLDRTPERIKQFLARHPYLPVERFAAVDGAAIDRSACVREGIIAADNDYKPGAIGIAMSHVSLWRQCAAGTTAFHIVEDDVVLRHDFQAVAQRLLDTLDEWDVVLWGHNFDWPVQIRPAQGIGIGVVQYDHQAVDETSVDSFRSDTVIPFLAPLYSAAGICCYSVSPSGAARMLADCLPIRGEAAEYLAKTGKSWNNTGIDVEMSRHYPKWRAYVAMPPVAVSYNDQSTSTIRGHLAAIHDPAIANRALR